MTIADIISFVKLHSPRTDNSWPVRHWRKKGPGRRHEHLTRAQIDGIK